MDDIKYLDDIRKYYDDATLVPDYVLETKTNIVEKEVFIELPIDIKIDNNISNCVECTPCEHNQTTIVNDVKLVKEEKKVLKYYNPNDLWTIIQEKKHNNTKKCLDLVGSSVFVFNIVNKDIYTSFNNLFVEFCEEKKEE